MFKIIAGASFFMVVLVSTIEFIVIDNKSIYPLCY